jgi:hypothetical protein
MSIKHLMKFAAVLFIALFQCNGGTPTLQDLVPTGTWGGKGIQLEVKEDGAKVDYGCDSGTIEGKVKTDARGNFVVHGTHVFGRGGPRNAGEPARKSHQARYEGVLNGDKMELKVRLPELDRDVGEFSLQHDRRPILERCG